MDNTFFIIAIILTLLFGVAFFSWGVYQIKTGKMVAKRAKKSVDEPRQVGISFLFVSLACFWVAYILIMNYFSIEPTPLISLIFASVEMGFCITTTIYGLVKKRIFGFKNTAKISKHVKKYYLTVNISLLIAMTGILALFSNIVISSYIASYILRAIIGAAIFTATFLMLKIEREYKKSA